jgi:mutator protein MutT
MTPPRTLVVTAAVIMRDGRFLVTRRRPGVPLAGLWEFPGGKCEPGEALEECLRRELREELGVYATVGGEVLVTTHDYDDRRVELHFFRCRITGMPIPKEGQEMRWVVRSALPGLQFPAADDALIALLTGRTAAP